MSDLLLKSGIHNEIFFASFWPASINNFHHVTYIVFAPSEDSYKPKNILITGGAGFMYVNLVG